VNDQAQRLRELAGTGVFDAVADGAPTPKRRCTSIAVTSGKGGVGKTNIALFLAVALARMRKRVLLVDADLGLANVHILLGAAPRRNLSHMVSGECTVNEIVSKGPLGVDILPGASGIEKMADLDRTALLRLERAFDDFEQGYDFLVVDTAAGIGPSVTGFAARADLPLVVVTPEPTSLADAYSLIKVLYEHGAPQIAVVVNMAASDREGAETFDRLRTLVVKFLRKGIVSYGTLPFDKEVPRYVRKQQVLVLEEPGNRFSERVLAVAWKISGRSPQHAKGFFAGIWEKCYSK
jgi:flagellar biosynthesis protein FlhG